MNYKKELASRVKTGKSLAIERLEMKKRGHPYLLGEEMDRQLQEPERIKPKRPVINSAIVISVAEGIIESYDSNLLKSNGGHIKCTKH